MGPSSFTKEAPLLANTPSLVSRQLHLLIRASETLSPTVRSLIIDDSVANQPSTATAAVRDVEILYSQNWAGTVLVGANFTSVTALVKIPTISMPPGGGVNAQYATATWVGIDGVKLPDAGPAASWRVHFRTEWDRPLRELDDEFGTPPSVSFPNFAVKAGEDVLNILSRLRAPPPELLFSRITRLGRRSIMPSPEGRSSASTLQNGLSRGFQPRQASW